MVHAFYNYTMKLGTRHIDRLFVRWFLLFCGAMMTAASAFAQVQVESSIDPIQILIGEQAHLKLQVSYKKGLSLILPQFKQSEFITPGVEVLEMSQADTAQLDNGMISVSRIYTLTSFDEQLYYLPPLPVQVDGKKYQSKNLALKVLTVPVDTLHPENFYPPKDVQDNPFLWSEWRGVFWLSLMLLFLFCLTCYLFICLKGNKPIVARVRIIKKVLPHQRAMDEIEKIKADRMVASENQKEYYTRLTDTLRKYMQERFGFNAMEMTSSEIIARLQEVEDKKMIDELRELFTTADLVKFAKYKSLINENDANLVNAIEFINSTKQENQPTTERIEPQLTEKDKRSMRSRTVLKITVSILIVVMVVLFGYVFYRLYMLI